MKQSAEDGKAPVKPGKRPYAPPALVEYGSVAKLTQGSITLQSDFTSGFKKSCL